MLYFNLPRTAANIDPRSASKPENNWIAIYDVESIRRVHTDFPCRATDVYVTTYPKCGTTWTTAIVDHLKKQVTAGVATGFSFNSCPWVDLWASKPERWQESLKYFETMENPRVFKSHSTVGLVKHPIGEKARIIHCVRNPLDTFVSGWHHMRQKKGFNYDGSWEHFFENHVMKDEFENGCWFQYHDEFLQAMDNKTADILLLKYEEMKADEGVEAVHEIAKFIGVSDYDAEHISAQCTFKSMKSKGDKVGFENPSGKVGTGFVDTHEGNSAQHSNAHIRKGIVGDWKNYYTEPQMEQWRAFVEMKLAKYPKILRLYSKELLMGSI